VDEHEMLAEQFEANRSHLRAVAYRVLGSPSEADDAVQEAWLRLSRSDAGGIENLSGWLTTVVARVCLDMLRSRASRREEPLDALGPQPALGGASERVAFVLHDLFGVPFDEIAPVVGRSPVAARQLASRARRRVRVAAASPGTEAARQRAIVDAFLAAARGGDFAALLALLDPDIVVHADGTAAGMGAPAEIRGAEAVAGAFAGRAVWGRPATVDGAAGAVWAPGGKPRVVFAFTIVAGKIVDIAFLADPERISGMDVTILPR
jgi:RNA polymerase sigma-70 factor, ECF subfamily